MRNLNLQINNLDPYITSSRSVKKNSVGWVLEPKVGKVSLNFEEILGTDEIEVKLKRISGNGKIVIRPGEGEYRYQIFSKDQQSIFLSVGKGDIEILSADDCLGEVAIIGCCAYTYNEDNSDDMKWKNILNRLNYNGLKVVGNRCFAGAGAIIKDATTSSITTQPEGKVIDKDGDWFFPESCEVISIEILSSVPHKIEEKVEPFVSIDLPAEIIPPPHEIKEKVASAPVIYQPQASIPPAPVREMLIYDSKVNNQFSIQRNRSTDVVKFISSNGQDFLVLKRGGSYQIDLVGLQTNKHYVVVVNGKRIGGNGRVWVSFDRLERKELLLDGNLTERFVNISLGTQPSTLTLEMLDDGTGEVIINRLRLINGISMEEAKSSIEYSAGSNSFVYVKKKERVIISNFNIDDEGGGRNDVQDAVMKACCFKPIAVDDNFTDIVGEVYSPTRSGVHWISKVKSFLPNVLFYERQHLLTSDTLVVTSLDNLMGKKIWLDWFKEDRIKPHHIEYLKGCSGIASPSESNIQLLKHHLPSVSISKKFKPLPFLQEREVPYFKGKRYYVVLNRNPEITKRLIESWREGSPKLAIVGSRGSSPDNTIPINEYLDFRRITSILKNSSGLIDIRPEGADYLSGWQDLSRKIGVPVLTNSWGGIDKDVLLPNYKSNLSIGNALDSLALQRAVADRQSPDFYTSIAQFFK